jgi:hypothetical protein
LRIPNLKKHGDMLDSSLLEQLRIAVIKYVRYAQAGNNDASGVVEIKLYDLDDVVATELDLYGCKLESRSRKSRVLKMGSALMKEIVSNARTPALEAAIDMQYAGRNT